MSDDDDLFGKAMRDVSRIESEPRRVARPATQGVVPQKGRVARPVLPEGSAHRPAGGDEPWILKADGVSAERLRQLAAGRPGIDREADLHGMTREQMYRSLATLMEQAVEAGWRVLSLVHGRGLHSEDGRPVLKQAVYEWLCDGPYAGWVLAALPRPGTGGGSVLVLLRRRRP